MHVLIPVRANVYAYKCMLVCVCLYARVIPLHLLLLCIDTCIHASTLPAYLSLIICVMACQKSVYKMFRFKDSA